MQDFDEALGPDGEVTDTALPAGWSVIVADQEQQEISGSYPPQDTTADTFITGPEYETDRALALGNAGDDGLSQFQLQLKITDQDLHALSLSFDLEFWGGDPALAADPGTVELQVSLQIDEGGGFVPLADLGTVSTGPSLSPSDTIILDGNVAKNRVRFESGVIDAPVPSGAVLRVDFAVPTGDAGTGFIYGLDNVRIQTLLTGDANGDGDFTSSDMVMAFQAGRYEQSVAVSQSNLAAAVDWLSAQDQADARPHAYVA